MAAYHGKTAKVDDGAAIGQTTSWTLSTSGDVAESTDMNDTFKLYEPGFDDATATVEGLAATTRDTVTQCGAAVTLKLYIDATNYFTFAAICTNVAETVDLNDVGKISYTYVMNAATGVTYG